MLPHRVFSPSSQGVVDIFSFSERCRLHLFEIFRLPYLHLFEIFDGSIIHLFEFFCKFFSIKIATSVVFSLIFLFLPAVAGMVV